MLATDTLARPARFDAPSQHRRGMIAKIHIAKKDLAISDDDYAQILLEEGGQISCSEIDDVGLGKVLDRMKRLGFKPTPSSVAVKPAQHPVARKARALWISLYHLNAVRNPAEQALEAFAKRQLGCEKFSWARQSEGYRVIEALKAMAEREGWAQGPDWRRVTPVELQERLCIAIVRKLHARGIVPRNWTLNDAAFRLTGIELVGQGPATAEQYARLAKALGEKLREYGTQAEMSL